MRKRYFTRKEAFEAVNTRSKVAAYIYLDILKPFSQKKKSLLVQTSYAELQKFSSSKGYYFSHGSLARHFKRLEIAGLIKRNVKDTVSNKGKVRRNTLFIELLENKKNVQDALEVPHA